MNASEARKLSETGGKVNDGELNRVHELIKLKASLGLRSTAINATLELKPIIEVLKNEGYKCKLVPDFRDGDYWEIKW